MAVWVDQMFNIAANSTTLAGMNGGVTAAVGPYNPAYNGRLIRATIMMVGQAATSLLEFLRVEMSCNIFIPNTIRLGGAGGAIRTAPAFPISPQIWDLDQPVQTTQGINANYLFSVTSVTPGIYVYGHMSDQMMPRNPIPGF